MTEVEWLACTHPSPMLTYLEERASDRKLMLFSVACLRRIWHLVTDLRSRNLIEATERLVDDWAGKESRSAFNAAFGAFRTAYASEQLQDGADGDTHEAVEHMAHSEAGAAMGAASKAAEAAGHAAALSVADDNRVSSSRGQTDSWRKAERAERAAQALLLHDIIGNPFRPVSTVSTWLTPQIISLAGGVYRERSFERMPELADALERAGCVDADLIDHCRRRDGHVRGCWVLDALLGNDDGMSEADWLACGNPRLMWWSLRPKPSRRKQQLFAAACCRRIWHLLTDERCRKAVEVLERLADGQAMQDEWYDAQRAAGEVTRHGTDHEIVVKVAAAVETADCGYGPIVPAAYAAEASGRSDEPAMQAALLRDVIGNPARPTVLEPSWRTPGVLELAQAIYGERAFHSLPALGNALEQAGCRDHEILGHCREPGQHVRGCWVLDLFANLSLSFGMRAGSMTADEWESSNDADKMLYAIGLTASKRKLRLFACACCRRVWDLMTQEMSRKGVETAERFADGLAGREELALARKGTGAAWCAVMSVDRATCMAARAAHFACLDHEQQFLRVRQETRNAVRWSVVLDAQSQAIEDEKSMLHLNGHRPLYYAPQRLEAVALETTAQALLLRDIFGSSFGPPQGMNLTWLRPPVLAVAQLIYEQRAFEKMPELGEALEQVGCDDVDILAHCYRSDMHMRGCWVVDLLLGRA